jgi:hypothetical protein
MQKRCDRCGKYCNSNGLYFLIKKTGKCCKQCCIDIIEKESLYKESEPVEPIRTRWEILDI